MTRRFLNIVLLLALPSTVLSEVQIALIAPTNLPSESSLLCVATGEHMVQIVPAITDVQGSASRESSPVTVVGCLFHHLTNTPRALTLLAQVEDGSLTAYPVEEAHYLGDFTAGKGSEQIQEQITLERDTLKKLRNQSTSQIRALARLRKDAELINAQEGIREREQQVVALQEQVHALEQQRAAARLALKRIPQEQQPAAHKEIELTKQLALYAALAKAAEDSGRAEQQANPPLDQEPPLDPIAEDPEAIQQELIKLRRRRQELEEVLAEKSVNPLDYE